MPTLHPDGVFQGCVCLGCGCLCDDVEVAVADDRIVETRNSCELGKTWFAARTPTPHAFAFVDGSPVAPEIAVERAAAILAAARAPLIYGLEDACTDDQRVAAALAERLGGVVDVGTPATHAAVRAFQEVGQSTCTLGEVRSRADTIVFWDCDPAATHPRHLERYSREPASRFLPNGASDRTLIVVGDEPNATAEQADLFLRIPQRMQYAALLTLHALVLKRPFALTPDLPLAPLQETAERLRTCNYGAWFYEPNDAHFAEAVLRLVRDLNRFTCWNALTLGAGDNRLGAENVLAWQAGFPFAVSFARGFPEFGPTHFTANALLERGRCDAAILLSGKARTRLSGAANAALSKVPTIALTDDPTSANSSVAFVTAPFNTGAAGAVYRIDEVPLPKRKLLASAAPSVADVLAALLDRLPSA